MQAHSEDGKTGYLRCSPTLERGNSEWPHHSLATINTSGLTFHSVLKGLLLDRRSAPQISTPVHELFSGTGTARLPLYVPSEKRGNVLVTVEPQTTLVNLGETSACESSSSCSLLGAIHKHFRA